MTAPRVSVVMPVYNGGDYLGPAVESILRQTYRDFELLALDDGSTDGSGEALEAFARRDTRVQVIHQPNQGLIATLNRGLEHARGEYIARMDADDLSAPVRLERQVAFLDAHPEIAVLGTPMYTMNAEGQRLGITPAPIGPALVRWTMLLYSAIAHPTVMARRGVLLQAGGYEAEFIHAEDYALWTRLALHTQLTNLDELLYTYRWWPLNVSTRFRAIQLENSARIVQRYTRELLGLEISLDQAHLAVLPTVGKPLMSLSEAEISASVEHVLMLYEAFVASQKPAGPELAAIRAAVGDYLYPLVAVAAFRNPPAGFRLARQLAAVSKNPRALIRRAVSKLRHTLRR